jgi:hypothetical protein
MAEYANADLGVSFSVPDALTVRDQLKFYSAGQGSDAPWMEQMWESARTVIKDWKCEVLPDLKADLDKVTDVRVTRIVAWVGATVARHMTGLEVPDPNS